MTPTIFVFEFGYLYVLATSCSIWALLSLVLYLLSMLSEYDVIDIGFLEALVEMQTNTALFR